MKKIFSLLILLIILTGCNNKEKIGMIMEKNEDSFISIHYPLTNIKKMDREIQKYVRKEYQIFKSLYVKEKKNIHPEFNMDYTYFVYQENIHTVSLKTYTNDFKKTKKEEIKCITYDKKKKKELYLSDLISGAEWKEFIHMVRKEIIRTYPTVNLSKLEEKLEKLSKKYSDFTFDEEKLTIYFKNENIVLEVSLNIQEIPSIIKVSKESKVYEEIQEVDLVVDPNKPVIALTFDDGPTIYTEEVLEILKKEDVVATFFVLGNKVESYPDVIRKAVKAGNEIGNHTYNHKWLSRLSHDEIKSQIEKTQENVKKITGTYPRFLRPTYGSINQRIRSASDLNIVLWDIDPKDWKNQSPEKIAKSVISKASDGKIILLHDNHKRTLKAIEKIIPELKEKGYQFVTLSELEEVKLLRRF